MDSEVEMSYKEDKQEFLESNESFCDVVNPVIENINLNKFSEKGVYLEEKN